ncbi:MAG: hypothetical protein LBG87_01790 [Spirochaetaceae bacterium]|jgi:hypothetical protein|nr:hypothetical protein [Spirochaetaceae bacterium]
MKKSFYGILFFSFCVFGFAQEATEEPDVKDKRLRVELQLKADAFRLTTYMFTHPEIRGKTAQDYTIVQWPLNNIDYYTDDSFLEVAYNAEHYGGAIRFTNSAVKNGQFALLKGWVQFKFIRITVGNVIGSTYADVLGAPEPMRIYMGKNDEGTAASWTHYRKTDNITGDEGVLLEGLFGPLTVAVAGGNFEQTLDWLGPISNTNDYELREGLKIRYGGRVGYEIGKWGKLNASYMIEGRKIYDAYGFKRNSTEMAPKQADAEYYNHLLGLYGSLHLTDSFDLTAGYVAGISSYLSEFYSQSQNDMVSTGQPLVFRNGINLNARMKAGAFTLRTDNSINFWIDKDYRLFETGNTNGWKDVGLDPSSLADAYSDISHFIMWNGFGLSYPLMERISLNSYLRNLFSIYNAEGTVPTGSGTYEFIRDEINFEIGLNLAYNANIEAFVNIGVIYNVTKRSQDLNAQSPGYFIPFIDNNSALGIPSPVETIDHSIALRIPIGIKVKY